jgi:hypothetical protein
MMCGAVSIAIWHLPQIWLSNEVPVLQGYVLWLMPFHFSVHFLWSIFVPQEWGITSYRPQSSCGWKAYIWDGAARCQEGSFATLLSPPQCHAAFGTMPHTLVSVDKDSICHPRLLTSSQQGCLGLDFGRYHYVNGGSQRHFATETDNTVEFFFHALDNLNFLIQKFSRTRCSLLVQRHCTRNTSVLCWQHMKNGHWQRPCWVASKQLLIVFSTGSAFKQCKAGDGESWNTQKNFFSACNQYLKLL